MSDLTQYAYDHLNIGADIGRSMSMNLNPQMLKIRTSKDWVTKFDNSIAKAPKHITVVERVSGILTCDFKFSVLNTKFKYRISISCSNGSVQTSLSLLRASGLMRKPVPSNSIQIPQLVRQLKDALEGKEVSR